MQQLKVNCASWERQILSEKLSLISWKRQVLIIFCVNWHLGICRWMPHYTPHRPFDPKSWLELPHRESVCDWRSSGSAAPHCETVVGAGLNHWSTSYLIQVISCGCEVVGTFGWGEEVDDRAEAS